VTEISQETPEQNFSPIRSIALLNSMYKSTEKKKIQTPADSDFDISDDDIIVPADLIAR
jgi:hypothetical protein